MRVDCNTHYVLPLEGSREAYNPHQAVYLTDVVEGVASMGGLIVLSQGIVFVRLNYHSKVSLRVEGRFFLYFYIFYESSKSRFLDSGRN